MLLPNKIHPNHRIYKWMVVSLDYGLRVNFPKARKWPRCNDWLRSCYDLAERTARLADVMKGRSELVDEFLDVRRRHLPARDRLLHPLPPVWHHILRHVTFVHLNRFQRCFSLSMCKFHITVCNLFNIWNLNRSVTPTKDRSCKPYVR